MKTATIKVHEVFGTNGKTVFAGVYYRNKPLWESMKNETINIMLARAQDFARTYGFTHWKIEE